jgi:hypothetical protein
MNKMNKKNIVIGIAVVVITAAIAFGVWEMRKGPKCTSINELSVTDPIRRQCENVKEKNICKAIHVGNDKDNRLCQWRGFF